MIEQLISAAREGVDQRRRDLPLAELEAQLHVRGEDRPFSEALVRPGLSLIAEFKRRSPSAGEISSTATVEGQVGAYERGGAAARGLDLDCLVEVHDEGELERALEADADVIGINNRNLDEGTVDVATTYELMPDVPAGKTVVAESGISERAELEELERVGVDAVLIGGALMSAADPEAKARELAALDEGTREHRLP